MKFTTAAMKRCDQQGASEVQSFGAGFNGGHAIDQRTFSAR
jgi:hypothetical protein